MNRYLLASINALALLGACAHRPTPLARLEEDAMPRCPMSVPGTRLALGDTRGGEQLSFRTEEEVEALQSRVQAMADLHNLRHAVVSRRQASPPGRAPGPRARWQGAAMPPSYATVEEVEGGAILEVTADAPDDIQQLRYAMRLRGWHLQHQGCATAPAPQGS